MSFYKRGGRDWEMSNGLLEAAQLFYTSTLLSEINDLLILKFKALYKHSLVYSSLSKGHTSPIHGYK